MFDLKSKVALITGGANGIGLSIAKELLRNELKGVALLDLDTENGLLAVNQLSKEFGKNAAIYIKVDVTERSEFEDAFKQTIKAFGQLDIVINNAGIVQEMQWEKCIAVNLQGCITGSLLALDKYFPMTLGTSEGIIVNVSSVMGLFPTEFLPVYSATKHGVIGFSRSIAGPNRCPNLNVKVLVICPGLTKTSLLTPAKDHMSKIFSENALEFWEKLPLQTPEELAQHAMPIIKEGQTGSVWAINGNVTEEIEFPKVFDLKIN